MAPKLKDSVSLLKKLGFGTFKFESDDKFDKSKQVWKLIQKYDPVFKRLKIDDPEQQETLFNLLEDNLIDNAESGTQATNAEVVAAKNPWTKLKAKLKFFYDIDLLKSQARTKLRHIKQNNRTAKQLLVDILKLWKLAEYTEDEEQILTTLLLALRDPQVKLQYELSLLKTSTIVKDLYNVDLRKCH